MKSSIMISRFIIYVITIIFVVSIYFLVKELNIKELKCEELSIENTLLQETFLQQCIHNGDSLGNLQLSNEKGNFQLIELLDDDYKLIFRFSELQCSSCIDFIFDELKLLSPQFPCNKLIIIGAFRNKRTYLKFKEKKNLIYPIYYEDIHLVEDGKNESPSLFLLNKEQKIKSLFYPIKGMHFLFQNYITNINNH